MSRVYPVITILLTVLTCLTLNACTDAQKPETVKQSSNQDFNVGKLFTYEGIDVYCFRHHGHNVYFTSKGDAYYSYRQTKHTNHVQCLGDDNERF